MVCTLLRRGLSSLLIPLQICSNQHSNSFVSISKDVKGSMGP